MLDKEVIEMAEKIKKFCKKNVCYKCQFNNDNECILQEQPPLHWELEKIERKK